MTRVRETFLSWLISGLCVLTVSIANSAFADNAKIDGTIAGNPLFVVTAEANGKTGTVQFSGPNVPASGQYYHNFMDGTSILAQDGTLLGTVDYVTISLNSDPVISTGFAVTAAGFDTYFTITSTSIGFSAVSNTWAISSGATTITDNNANGSTLVGGYLGGLKSFQPNTNLGAFALIVDNLSTPANNSTSDNEAFGWSNIAGSVNTMSTQWAFTLSANDQASGTGVFALVVPEPSSVIALAVGMLGLVGSFVRRRSA